MKELFPGVFEHKGTIMTRDLTPGKNVYGEKTYKEKGVHYRVWDPHGSKPAAAMKNGLKAFPIKSGDKMLYLGVGTGRTASHISDIIGLEGMIIGVDLGYLPLQKVLDMSEYRDNITPILADARRPDQYKDSVPKKVDIIYEDLAQFDQTDILIRNAKRFLKKGGYIIYMVKARSIRSYVDPKEVFKTEIDKLKKAKFKILDAVLLEPYIKDHIALIAQK